MNLFSFGASAKTPPLLHPLPRNLIKITVLNKTNTPFEQQILKDPSLSVFHRRTREKKKKNKREKRFSEFKKGKGRIHFDESRFVIIEIGIFWGGDNLAHRDRNSRLEGAHGLGRFI